MSHSLLLLPPTLETGKPTLWNWPRQLSEVNTRSQNFSVLDPFQKKREVTPNLFAIASQRVTAEWTPGAKVWFCSTLSAALLPRRTRRKQANPLHLGGTLHATIASTNSSVKQRHLSRMLKALRAEASVTSTASVCQRWLKS